MAVELVDVLKKIKTKLESVVDDAYAAKTLYDKWRNNERYIESKHHVNFEVDSLPSNPDNNIAVMDPKRKVLSWWDEDRYEFPTFVDEVKADDVTVENTNQETAVFQADVNTHALQNGRVFILRLFGQYSTASSNDSFTYRVKTGPVGFDPVTEGQTIVTITSSQENVTEAPLRAKSNAVVDSQGVNGEIDLYTESAFNNDPQDVNAPDEQVDTTTGQSFAVTVEWGAAKADNSCTVSMAYLQQQG